MLWRLPLSNEQQAFTKDFLVGSRSFGYASMLLMAFSIFGLAWGLPFAYLVSAVCDADATAPYKSALA